MKKFIAWLRKIFRCKKGNEVTPIPTSVPTSTPAVTSIPNVTPAATNTGNCGFEMKINLVK